MAEEIESNAVPDTQRPSKLLILWAKFEVRLTCRVAALDRRLKMRHRRKGLLKN
jgi:hypothetical protein